MRSDDNGPDGTTRGDRSQMGASGAEMAESSATPFDAMTEETAVSRLAEVSEILAMLDRVDEQIAEYRRLLVAADAAQLALEAAPSVEAVPAIDPGVLEIPSLQMPELFAELEYQRIAGLHRNAYVSVYYGGEEILSYLSGETGSGVAPHPRPLYRAFSAGKPMVAATVWRLLDRGVLDIDAPVARYWPEFAQRGKSAVTLRHVLTHTAGLPLDHARADVDWGDWGRMVDILATMPLEYQPGKVIHYHSITFGLLVAEIASRAADLEFAELFEREVRSPLGLEDTYFTISFGDTKARRRVQPLATASDYHDREMPSNMDWLLDNQINSPGGTCITTASDLARLYSVVCNHGTTLDGESWLSADGAANVFATHASAYDIEQMTRARIGQGVWMYDEQPNRIGSPTGSSAFGHGGMGTSIAWGDPEHGIGVAILTDTMQEEALNGARLNRISAAIRNDLALPVGSVAEL